MIKKIASKYVVLSKTTGRKFGSCCTKKEAMKRLRQVEFFNDEIGSNPCGLAYGLALGRPKIGQARKS